MTEYIVLSAILFTIGCIGVLTRRNAIVVFRCIELMLNLVPVASENFQWDFTFTGAYNKTKVLSLLTDEPGKSITVGQHVFNGWVNHVVGEEQNGCPRSASVRGC